MEQHTRLSDLQFSRESDIKTALFWEVKLCSLIEVYHISEEMTVCMFRAASYSNMFVPNPHCMSSYAEDHNLHNSLDSRCPLLLPNTTMNINKKRKIFKTENFCDAPETLLSTLLMLQGSNFSFPIYFKMDIPVITCLQIV